MQGQGTTIWIRKRALLVLLFLPFILIAVSIAAFSQTQEVAISPFAERSPQDEIVGLRNESSRSYQNPDGSITAIISSGPIHYKDAEGAWQDIDTTLSVPTKSGYGYSVTKSPVKAHFAATADGWQCVETDGHSIQFAAQGASPKSIGIADGSSITYPDAWPGIDLKYTAIPTGLKEELVLKRKPALGELRFALRACSLRVNANEDGSIGFLDSSAKSVATMPAAFAEDSAKARKDGISLRAFDQRDGSFAVPIPLDIEWLDKASYPVILDPTLICYSAKDGDHYNSIMPPGGTWSSLGPCVRIGPGLTGCVKFNTSVLPAATSISQAQIVLYPCAYEFGFDVDMKQITSDFWPNNGYPPVLGQTLVSHQQWVITVDTFESAALLSLAQAWVAWPSYANNNCGVALTLSTPADRLAGFHSVEFAPQPPFLCITYDAGGDATSPTTDSVGATPQYVAPAGSIAYTWQATDQQTPITQIRALLMQSDPTPNDWDSATPIDLPPAGAGTRTGGDTFTAPTSPRGVYRVYVKTKNSAGLWSAAAQSDPVMVTYSGISDLFSLTTGSTCALSSKVCTAGNDQLDGEFYIEESDSSSGIRVKYSGATTVPAGKLVSVGGHVGIDEVCNEFTFYADTVTVGADATIPAPVQKTNAQLGGADQGQAPGVTDPVGIYNKGLLVETTGLVYYVDENGEFFYLWDSNDPQPPEDGSGLYGIRVSMDRLLGDPLTLPTAGDYRCVRGISSSIVIGANTARTLRPRDQEDIETIHFAIPAQPLTGVQSIYVTTSVAMCPMSEITISVDDEPVPSSFLDIDLVNGEAMLLLDTTWLEPDCEHTIQACATDSASNLVCRTATITTERGVMGLTSDKTCIRIEDGMGGISPEEMCTITATPDPVPPTGTDIHFVCDTGTFADPVTLTDIGTSTIVETDASGHAVIVFHAAAAAGTSLITAIGGGCGGSIYITQADVPSEVVFIAPDYYCIAGTSASNTGTASVAVRDATGYPVADGTAVSYSFSGALQLVSASTTVDGVSDVVFRSTTLDDSVAEITASPTGIPSVTATANVNVVWPWVNLTADRYSPAASTAGAAVKAVLSAPEGASVQGIPVQFHWQGACTATFSPSDTVTTDADGAAEVHLVGDATAAGGRVWATYGDAPPWSKLVEFTVPCQLRVYCHRADTADTFVAGATLRTWNAVPVADGTEVTFTTTDGWFDVNGTQQTSVTLHTADESVSGVLHLAVGEAATVTADTDGLTAESVSIENEAAAAYAVHRIEPLGYLYDCAATQSAALNVEVTDAATGQPVPQGTNVHFVCTNGGSVQDVDLTTDNGQVTNTFTVTSPGVYWVEVSSLGVTTLLPFRFAGTPGDLESVKHELITIAADSPNNLYRVWTRVLDAADEPVADGYEVGFWVDGVLAATSYTASGAAQAQFELAATVDSVDLHVEVTGWQCESDCTLTGLANRVDNLVFQQDTFTMPWTMPYEEQPQCLFVSVRALDQHGNPVPNGTPVRFATDYGGFYEDLSSVLAQVTLPTSDGWATAQYCAPVLAENDPYNANLTATVGSSTLQRQDTAIINFVP